MKSTIGDYVTSQIERNAKCPKAFDGYVWVSSNLARLVRAAELGCYLHMKQDNIHADQAKINCQKRREGKSSVEKKVEEILSIMQDTLEKSCTKRKALDRAYDWLQKEEIISSSDSFSATSDKVYKMLKEHFPEYAWVVGVFPVPGSGRFGARAYRAVQSPGMHRMKEDWKGRNTVIFMTTPFEYVDRRTGKTKYSTDFNDCMDHSAHRTIAEILKFYPFSHYYHGRKPFRSYDYASYGRDLNLYAERIKKILGNNVRTAIIYDYYKKASWRGKLCELNHPRVYHGAPWYRVSEAYYQWIWAL